MTGGVDLSVVIVNWNAGSRLQEAIDSIVSAPPRGTWEIVVVDNASTDGSIDAVRSHAVNRSFLDVGRLRVISNATNVGFGAANNQGFAASTGGLVLLLNPDAAVAAGAVDVLTDVLDRDPSAGAVGPQLLGPNGEVQASVFRNPPRVADILVSCFGLYRLLPRSIRARWLLGSHWAHDERRRVPMVIGAAMLVRRRVIDEVGGFDERFHVYGEDHEWCLRITRAGWHVVFEPRARVRHEGGASAAQRWDRLEAVEPHVRAEYLLDRIALSPWQVVAIEGAQLVGATGQFGSRLVRGLDRRAVRIALRLHGELLTDAVRRLFRPDRG